MGFYSTSRLIIDAKDHGVEVRDIDVNYSYWDSTLEPAPGKHGQALRLGFREIRGFKQEDADRLVEARDGGYSSIRELWRRGELGKPALTQLSKADAFGSLGLDRRAADWAIRGLSDAELPLFDFAETIAPDGNQSIDDVIEEEIVLPRMTAGENVIADYRYKGHSNRPHPLKLLRHRLHNQGIVTARDLENISDGKRVRIAGLVQVRQRPGTASGVIFATLQDETGDSNAIIWPTVFDKFRRETLGSKLMIIEGKLQKRIVVMDGAEQKKVATIHVVADSIINGNEYLGDLGEIDIDADFNILSKADEMKSPPRQPKEALVALPDSRDFR
jgi:error-prone DNA polymerase